MEERPENEEFFKLMPISFSSRFGITYLSTMIYDRHGINTIFLHVGNDYKTQKHLEMTVIVYRSSLLCSL